MLVTLVFEGTASVHASTKASSFPFFPRQRDRKFAAPSHRDSAVCNVQRCRQII